jgi:hypothetical protein
VIVTGVIAGLSLLAFETVATAFLTGASTAGEPLRMLAALVTGPGTLDPQYPAGLADTMGVGVDLLLSIAFSGIFAVLTTWLATATRGELLTTTPGLVLAGLIFGTVLWLVNFYGIGQLAGWTWLSRRMNHDVAFLGHALFFGAPLGWMLGRASSHAREEASAGHERAAATGAA